MNFENHPCFNDTIRHKYGRIHLPVAPKCNIQCNYCDRKYDCVNESRPGVTSTILTPEQALAYLRKVINKNPSITVVGIAGPGDPFANPDETMKTLRLVHQNFPEMLICLATNGLNIAPYIDELAELNVSHVTLTVNTINPSIGSEIYLWVRDNKKIYRGVEGASLLLSRQLEAIPLLKNKGINVKINTILIPGINEEYILDTVKKVKSLGADILNCIPLFPNEETYFGDLPAPSTKMINDTRREIGKIMPQMAHCNRCRADAVGLLHEDMTDEAYNLLQESAQLPGDSNINPSLIAVASLEGFLINQHLGETDKVWIFENQSGKPVFQETRKVPQPGSGDQRWHDFANQIKDCQAILASGAGDNPKIIFKERGIKVLIAEGMIVDVLEDYFNGKKIRNIKTKSGCSKGIECSGNGRGCG